MSSSDDQDPPPPPRRFSIDYFDPLLSPEQSMFSPASLCLVLLLIAETTLPGERLSTYRKWHIPPDPSINHWFAHKSRQEDTQTAKWFLDRDVYPKACNPNGMQFYYHGYGKCAYLVQSSIQRLLRFPVRQHAFFRAFSRPKINCTQHCHPGLRT
jgi:hypothetical protein